MLDPLPSVPSVVLPIQSLAEKPGFPALNAVFDGNSYHGQFEYFSIKLRGSVIFILTGNRHKPD